MANSTKLVSMGELKAYYIWDEQSNSWFSGIEDGNPDFDYSFNHARGYILETAIAMVYRLEKIETRRKFKLIILQIQKVSKDPTPCAK